MVQVRLTNGELTVWWPDRLASGFALVWACTITPPTAQPLHAAAPVQGTVLDLVFTIRDLEFTVQDLGGTVQTLRTTN